MEGVGEGLAVVEGLKGGQVLTVTLQQVSQLVEKFAPPGRVHCSPGASQLEGTSKTKRFREKIDNFLHGSHGSVFHSVPGGTFYSQFI